MGYNIWMLVKFVRLINNITGAVIYKTGIESENSGPQKIIVTGVAKTINPVAIGKARAFIRLRDLFITLENPSVSPVLIICEQRGSNTVPIDVITVRAVWEILLPAVKKPTDSSPEMKPSIIELRCVYRLIIRSRTKCESRDKMM